MMSFILIIVYSFSYAQVSKEEPKNDFEIFSKYGKWGFSIMPVVYKKGTTTKDYGSISLNTQPMYSFQIGVQRHFWRSKEWGLIIGANIGWIPFGNYSFSLKKEDTPEGFDGVDEKSIFGFSQPYIFIPISVEYKKRIASNIFFNMNVGLGINVGINSFEEGFTSLITEDSEGIIEEREVFRYYLSTPDGIQYSATISSGMYFSLKNFMIRTNIVYNKNFKNLWEGEYQFGNLLVSDPTRGDYFVSGDYFGLSTTVFFKKRTKKRKNK